MRALRRITWAIAALVLMLSRAAGADDLNEPAAWVKKAFVILKSTPSYDQARKFSIGAARALDAKLDLRGLSPDKKAGLTFNRDLCAHEAGSFPCYWPRDRFDDGVYVSVEYSSGYKGFKDGLYIVVLANGDAEDESIKAALSHARARYPDAYIKTTSVYMGCVH